MRPARQAATVVWSLNTLLGLGILAYAAMAFMVARPDPLADLPTPAGRAALKPYVRDVGALKRMGVMEKKEADPVAAPSVDLSVFISVVAVGAETAKLHIFNDSTRQIWVNVGEDLHSKLLGHVPTPPDVRAKDIAPTRGWVLEKIEPRAASFRRGAETQRLGVSAAGGGGLVTADLATLRKKQYKAADYNSKVTTSGRDVLIAMDPKEIDWAVANQDDLLNTMELKPVDDGLAFGAVPPIMAKFGFQPNDLLTNINGTPIKSLDEIRRMVESNQQNFAKGGRFTVSLNRAGAGITLSFTVPPPPAKSKG